MNTVMGCEEVQEYLAERLAGSLSDRLSATVHSHVRTHMLSCPECCEEMEHFEEMQRMLQALPVEPCDSNAMRARFHLLVGPKQAETLRRNGRSLAPMIRPLKIALVSLSAMVALIAAFLAVRQAVKWISAARVAPPLATPATAPSPRPVPSSDIASAGAPASSVAPLAMAEITGRVLLEDGSEVSDAQSLGEIALSISGKSGSADPTMTIDANGRFDRTVAADEYRVRITKFSQNYLIQSMTAGGVDLLTDNLKLSGDSPVSVQIWVARRSGNGGGKVPGRALDVVTNDPSQVPQAVAIDVTLRLDTGGRLPYWPDTSIVFTGTNGAPRVAASCFVGNLFRASVPANESYALAVSNVAAGYAVQSIVDSRMTDLMHGGIFTAAASPAASSRIVVTLTKN
jgi:hypothetical protein